MRDGGRSGVKYRADLSQFVDGNAEILADAHSADAATPELNL